MSRTRKNFPWATRKEENWWFTPSKVLGWKKSEKKVTIRKMRHYNAIITDGLSSRELLNKEMELLNSRKYMDATAVEQQEMLSAIDMMAEITYSAMPSATKFKGYID